MIPPPLSMPLVKRLQQSLVAASRSAIGGTVVFQTMKEVVG